MKTRLILTSSNHPLEKKFKTKEFKSIEVDPVAIWELDGSDFEDVDIVYDFTCFDRATKLDLLEKISHLHEGEIMTDLTTNWGDYFIEHYPQITAAFAAAFYSPKNTIEVYSKDVEAYEEVTDFFKSIGMEIENTNSVGICFTYPRVISMIINEAYFSSEEKMATNEDIDTAMKFGVNYPLGPFEWAQKIGHDKVILVLDELYQVTGDPRYRVSRSLRMQM